MDRSRTTDTRWSYAHLADSARVTSNFANLKRKISSAARPAFVVCSKAVLHINRAMRIYIKIIKPSCKAGRTVIHTVYITPLPHYGPLSNYCVSMAGAVVPRVSKEVHIIPIQDMWESRKSTVL